jgi:hypothetical protein
LLETKAIKNDDGEKMNQNDDDFMMIKNWFSKKKINKLINFRTILIIHTKIIIHTKKAIKILDGMIMKGRKHIQL